MYCKCKENMFITWQVHHIAILELFNFIQI